jgi:signal transduction histidine kinase
MGLFDKRQYDVLAEPVKNKPQYGVLLVDDEILNLTSLTNLLEERYSVFVALSAQDALAQLSDPNTAKHIQVIVSDQRMPGMSGVEFLTQCRNLHPYIKRILLTGYSDLDIVVDAINKAAIYKYLRKPIDSQELLLTLERACELWQLEQDKLRLMQALEDAYGRVKLLDADKLAFLTYLMHELNTPLHWLSASQILDREVLSQEGQDVLDVMDQGLVRIRNLVTTVLRYFELAGSEPRLNPEPVLLNNLLQDEFAQLKKVYPNLQCILQAEQLVTAQLDFSLVQELLKHLVENAVTHALRGCGQIATVTVTLKISGDICECLIHNSGHGLDADALDNLFRPFFFTGSAHGCGGFGLSMASAQALASILGGHLFATSQGGVSGVTLKLTLPKMMGENLENRDKLSAPTS